MLRREDVRNLVVRMNTDALVHCHARVSEVLPTRCPDGKVHRLRGLASKHVLGVRRVARVAERLEHREEERVQRQGSAKGEDGHRPPLRLEENLAEEGEDEAAEVAVLGHDGVEDFVAYLSSVQVSASGA